MSKLGFASVPDFRTKPQHESELIRRIRLGINSWWGRLDGEKRPDGAKDPYGLREFKKQEHDAKVAAYCVKFGLFCGRVLVASVQNFILIEGVFDTNICQIIKKLKSFHIYYTDGERIGQMFPGAPENVVGKGLRDKIRKMLMEALNTEFDRCADFKQFGWLTGWRLAWWLEDYTKLVFDNVDTDADVKYRAWVEKHGTTSPWRYLCWRAFYNKDVQHEGGPREQITRSMGRAIMELRRLRRVTLGRPEPTAAKVRAAVEAALDGAEIDDEHPDWRCSICFSYLFGDANAYRCALCTKPTSCCRKCWPQWAAQDPQGGRCLGCNGPPRATFPYREAWELGELIEGTAAILLGND
jgi:hypothetical protein